ncbi:sulfur oxidation c-type cytochrome SoxX [Varunaivibrio sulfuroxidans]|uniref:Monoheme cytochrome SoxX (Sulfur oxidation) n=1 Tax=Varunaivibrio sulfuroxidans TaxID=1773489 RepID=A0A4R3JGG7_9PROT|nr:sulfur oxidation c-type cytochrome SoxX [Varunaivibrio sulfuroxidans]TCS64306.1 monoheme cytochrome SoxX (sulfur oxidation) [Varunaivibrio sulfuroxidans]WES31258.1 sulfur oxidation c-type cytochrome SoxX [Varunaivibrio sulfuroxidans]
MKTLKIFVATMGFALMGSTAYAAQVTAPNDVVIKDDTVPQSLTGVAGDPIRGRKIVINRKKGNCLACHDIKDIPEQPFHGQTGPALEHIPEHHSVAEMRMRLVDSKMINPATMMPSFYKLGQYRVLKGFRGKTVLSAQDVEDVIAYMMTLK